MSRHRASSLAAGVAIFGLLLCASACKRANPTGAVSPELVAARQRDVHSVQRLEHGRIWPSNEWSALAKSASSEARAALAEAIGRAAIPDGPPILEGLLNDPEAAVRRAAAFGLGCYEDRETGEAKRKLLARLWEETDGSVVASIVIALGRIGQNPSKLVIHRALEHFLLEVREAAGLAAGRLAVNRRELPRTLLPKLREVALTEKEASPRVAMAFAFSRLAGDPPAKVLEDRDPLVRFFAVDGFGKSPNPAKEPIFARLEDDDWRVRVAALGAAARLGPPARPVIAQALRAAWNAFVEKNETVKSERVQVVVAALEAAAPRGQPPDPAIVKVLLEVEADAKKRRADKKTYDAPSRRTLDHIDCRIARLLDLGEGLPRRVHTCGDDYVFDWVRARLAAQVITETTAKPAFERAPALRELVKSVDPRVRAAAAEAMAPLWTVIGTRGLVLDLLKSRDAGILAAIFETIGKRGGRDPELEAASLAAAVVLRSGRDAEPMIALTQALQAVGSPRSAPILARLAGDPVLAVREAARKAFRRLFPADPDPPPAHPPMTGFPPPVEKGGDELYAKVNTTKGAFDIRLLRATAPLTVGNFVALANRGFYKDQRIHRVVPAFVAQMGDPRGDGSGGPGYALPCELTETRYRRGSVGMALAGRDTGGSQFFITMNETPHLDGAYPLFGEVTRGLEVVDSLIEGDLLISVTIESLTPR